ncbi:MAG: MlaD family protein [Treponema sp.]|jgi:phospholipid/cholesterol/gamma-HCH transport system substrate-binding protein|nr:MlaD family protein [Treponema sp.]
MKFKIRFADQIAGFFIIVALISVVFIIVMLGRSQRWFATDYAFNTILPSAAGLGKNMPVQYKGFTIGNVKNFHLTEADEVEVIFLIHDQYVDRVKEGSMVELMVSPVGLGNQFLFHAGKGTAPLSAGDFIPAVGSEMARAYIRQGLASAPHYDDSISLLMNRASSVLDEIDRVLVQVEDAFRGSEETVIGQIVGGVNRTVAGAETLPGTIDKTAADLIKDIDDLKAILEDELERINPIIADVNALSSKLNDPEGLVYTVLDTNEEVYTSLVSSLNSVSSILENLDRTAAFIPGQLPQIAGLIMELRTTMKTAEDVLTALTNNPLLRRGIPERVETQSSGTSPRDIQF